MASGGTLRQGRAVLLFCRLTEKAKRGKVALRRLEKTNFDSNRGGGRKNSREEGDKIVAETTYNPPDDLYAMGRREKKNHEIFLLRFFADMVS